MAMEGLREQKTANSRKNPTSTYLATQVGMGGVGLHRERAVLVFTLTGEGSRFSDFFFCAPHLESTVDAALRCSTAVGRSLAGALGRLLVSVQPAGRSASRCALAHTKQRQTQHLLTRRGKVLTITIYWCPNIPPDKSEQQCLTATSSKYHTGARHWLRGCPPKPLANCLMPMSSMSLASPASRRAGFQCCPLPSHHSHHTASDEITTHILLIKSLSCSYSDRANQSAPPDAL